MSGFQLQVCLSMCDLSLPPGIKGLKLWLESIQNSNNFIVLVTL